MSIQEFFPYMLVGAALAVVTAFIGGFLKAAISDFRK